jgi:hypothetical protein
MTKAHTFALAKEKMHKDHAIIVRKYPYAAILGCPNDIKESARSDERLANYIKNEWIPELTK